MSHDVFNGLFTEIAPALNLLSVEVDPGKPFWRIEADEDFLIYAELDEARDCMVFYAEVGAPPSEGRLAFYELAMTYQFAWDSFEGGRLSLSDDRVWLIEDLSAVNLDLTKLREKIEGFMSRYYVWRDVVRTFETSVNKTEVLQMLAAPGAAP